MNLGPWQPRRVALVGLALAALTVAVFWPVRHFAFTNYDDQAVVTENAVVLQGLTWAGARWAFTTGHYDYWHPLSWLSHMLDVQLFGQQAGAHHLTNLALHTLNVLLLFLALRRLTGAGARSAVVAALVAVHPLSVDSVAWIAERKDVLSTAFWMLTLWAWARYAAEGRRAFYALALGSLALGLMAKAMLVTLPFVLLLLDVWPLGRLSLGAAGALPDQAGSSLGTPQPAAGRRLSQLVLEKVPFFVLAGIGAVITYLTTERGGGLVSAETLPWSVRLQTVPVAYVGYLAKLVWPVRLGVSYPHPYGWPAGMVLGALLALTAASAAVGWAGRRRPYLLVGWLWFLGTLVPVIGLVQTGPQYLAPRRMYVPQIGLYLMLVWGVADAAAARRWPQWALAGATAAAVAACAVLTRQQLPIWRNSVTLFRAILERTRDNAVAHYNLGQALETLGQTDEALAHYREATRIAPDYLQAHHNLGVRLIAQGRLLEASNHLARALPLAATTPAVHGNYAGLLVGLGHYQEAAVQAQLALQREPTNAFAHYHLARAWRALGRVRDADAHFAQATRLKPDFASAHAEWGQLALQENRFEAACERLAEAVRLRPAVVEYRAKLGVALAAAGRTREALAHYREALRLKPDHVEALNNLAWLLATHPDATLRDGPEAVRLAGRACELTGRKQPLLLGTLAAALAEAGQFDQAVATAAEAAALAESLGQPEVAARNRELLQLYQRGQPWRETR